MTEASLDTVCKGSALEKEEEDIVDRVVCTVPSTLSKEEKHNVKSY